MTKRHRLGAFAIAAAAALFIGAAQAPAARIDAPAPAFTAPDSSGHTVSLAQFAGKYVVLEWTNDGCPFVGKQYRSGNMQALQRRYRDKGVVWLSVVSSAPGQQGYVTAQGANDDVRRLNADPTAVLLDPQGTLGHEYGAEATPQMYVIDPKGVLRYMGAIDDKPSTNLADVKTARNYVAEALDDLMAGKAVATPVTRAYGCSVKYAS